jgi:hypothetical protein
MGRLEPIMHNTWTTPTDTRIAIEPQRFLLGLVDCNSILKKGLDPLCICGCLEIALLKEKQHPSSSCVSSLGCDRSQPDGLRTSSFERRSASRMFEWRPACLARLLCCFGVEPVWPSEILEGGGAEKRLRIVLIDFRWVQKECSRKTQMF